MSPPTVLVTGASSGIGLCIARAFLDKGAEVHGVDRDPCPDDRVKMVRCDLSQREPTLRVAKRLSEELPILNVLVNNAGQMERTPLQDLELQRWDKVIHSNLTAPLILSKALAPKLAKVGGAIINIASTRATMSEPDTESYSASKGGLVALTHSLAISLGPDVRVNCISPGWIDVAGESLREADHSQHPCGRVGRPEDVARLVCFLADRENSFLTGAEFIIDGGMTRKMIYEP